MKQICGALILTVLASTALADPVPFRRCFELASEQHQVPLSLLHGVARVESNFDPDARSSAGAHGLMQIQWPGTARHLGVRRVSELYNPCLNIDVGASYLAELLDRYDGNERLALAAYNYGPSRLKNESDIPPRVMGYVEKVMGYERTRVSSSQKAIVFLNRFDSRYIAESYVASLSAMLPSMSVSLVRARSGRYLVSANVNNATQSDINRLSSMFPTNRWLL